MGDSFRDLIVWQRAVQLSVALYRVTGQFPASEMYGLTSQLRRAGVSVASNIAEGYGRGSRADYRHFLAMARGSNHEVLTQITIARDLGFGEEAGLEEVERIAEEISRMLFAIMKKLEMKKKEMGIQA